MAQKCGRCKIEKPIEDFSPSYRGVVGTWCRPCFAIYNRNRNKGNKPPAAKIHDPVVCSWCARLYTPKQLKSGAAFCSRQCKDKLKKSRERRWRIASKPLRRCLHCGEQMPQTMRADAKFCSDRCNSAAHNATKKVAKRAARWGNGPYANGLLSRAEIAERSSWRCGICGGRIAQWREHPDPLCPSIDHVVALSAGGTNEIENLQLVHLVCNLRKGASDGRQTAGQHETGA